MPRTDGLLSDEEILSKFYMLNAAINLTKTQFGYSVCGQPAIITRVERGHALQHKTRKRITEALLELERVHTEPLSEAVKAKLAEKQLSDMEG